MTPVFATAYLGTVEYFKLLTGFENAVIDQHEHFQKQTLRNRCFILSPNGIQCLSIPLQHANGNKQMVKELKICYQSPWQRTHWRSLQTAYNRSPFFEYYADDFSRFYADDKFKWLLDFNMEQLTWVLKCLNKNHFIDKTNSFKLQADDFRLICNVKSPEPVRFRNFNPYNQVFGYKFGFTTNLSIIDLIFNMGGRSMDYLKESLN